MNYQNLIIADASKIRQITINRESKLNALNKDTIAELADIIEKSEQDSSIRVVILTGAGEKAFVAGADISEFSNYSSAEGEQLARIGQHKVFDRIHHSTKPYIAAVNGFALGGGLELALACHIRVAATHAKLGLPEVTLGVIPGYGGTQRLTQLVGRGKAMELITTADMVEAEEALQLGLVNHVVESAQLLDKAKEIAAKIISRSGTAVAAAIQAINASLDPTKNGYDEEIKAFGACFGTKDFVEGVSAFLEKRKPDF
jgi:enoyl-CoA hydratase